MKKKLKLAITVLLCLLIASILVACGTANLEIENPEIALIDTLDTLEVPNDSELETLHRRGSQGHNRHGLSNPVPLSNNNHNLYPNPYPNIENSKRTERKFVKSNNLLVNPSFEDNLDGWGCPPPNLATTSQITGGQAVLEAGVCFFQDVTIDNILQHIQTTGIYLTCQGSTESPQSSVFGIQTLDLSGTPTYELLQNINTTTRQWRIYLNGVDIANNTKSLRVLFYSDTNANYDYCYLTTEEGPELTAEVIYKPVKPLEVLVPLYVDPINDAKSWKKLIKTAYYIRSVPITTILNPSSTTDLCQYGDFENTLPSLQKAGIDTIGYVATGFGSTTVTTVTDRIDNLYQSCSHLDGIFFDEVQITDQTQLDHYNGLCDYVRNKYPDTKLVLNPGINTVLPLNNTHCNVAVIHEKDPESWEDFASYGFTGNAGEVATATLIYETMTDKELEHAVSLAYSRTFDYIYVTSETLADNPWDRLGDNWNKLIRQLAKNNWKL